MHPKLIASCLVVVIVATFVLLPATGARGDNLYVFQQGSGSIGEYTTTGQTINPTLISGFQPSIAGTTMAISGNNFYASYEVPVGSSNPYQAYVGEWTLSGQPVNTQLIPIPTGADGIAISGSDLYVAQDHVLAEYDLSGNVINSNVFTAAGPIGDVQVYNGDIYATVSTLNGTDWTTTISEYTLSGMLVNPAIASFGWIQENFQISNGVIYVPNESEPAFPGSPGLYEYTLAGVPVSMTTIPNDGYFGVAVSGNDMYLSKFNGIAEYTTSGTLINANAVTGPIFLNTMLLVPTPEPSSLVLLGIGSAALWIVSRRRPAFALS